MRLSLWGHQFGDQRGNSVIYSRLKSALRATLVVAGLLGLSACATIVEGTDQTVTVDTEPSGARCDLERGSETVAVVNPTPGSVTIDKSKDNVSVLCEKEGYQSASGSLSSEFQGMTFGNILFGGLIGVGIDASSGAMNEYPSSVTIALAPEEFSSVSEKNIYFRRQREIVEAEAEETLTDVRNNCNDSSDADCQKAIEAVEDSRDERLAELKVERARARVAGD